MADACLDVFDLTGNVVYEMMAEELAHYALRLMWDEEGGGFFDRARDDHESSDRASEPAPEAVRHQLRGVTHAAAPGRRFRRIRICSCRRPDTGRDGGLLRRLRGRLPRTMCWRCEPPQRGDTLGFWRPAPGGPDCRICLRSTTSLATLKNLATQLRIDSVRSTSEAGSGHPTTCLSAAEIVSTLFFAEMHYDAKNPQNPTTIASCCPRDTPLRSSTAAWAEAGLFPREELLKLRRIDSDLEGHPTPRLSFVDVATGSLGQGICAAIGTALNARRIGSEYRTYVLLGDGEMAEGSVWEAANVAVYHKLDNLCAVIDVNALGQSQHTQFGHHMDEIAARWKAFEWHTIVVDGHDVQALLNAYA